PDDPDPNEEPVAGQPTRDVARRPQDSAADRVADGDRETEPQAENLEKRSASLHCHTMRPWSTLPLDMPQRNSGMNAALVARHHPAESSCMKNRTPTRARPPLCLTHYATITPMQFPPRNLSR